MGFFFPWDFYSDFYSISTCNVLPISKHENSDAEAFRSLTSENFYTNTLKSFFPVLKH